MEKMKFQRWFAVVMVAVLMLSLVGCGGRTKPHDHGPDAKDKMYVSVDKNGHKTVVDKDGKAIVEFSFDKDGNIVSKDGEIVVPADKVKDLPKPPVKLDGKNVPADRNDKAGGQTGADETASSAKEDEDAVTEGSSSSSGFSSSSSSGSGSSSSSGSFRGSFSGGSSAPAPAPAPDPTPAPTPMPDPEPAPEPEPPAHEHDWKPVYRTMTMDVTRQVYSTWCVGCGQDMTDWTEDEIWDHSCAHLEKGEACNWASGPRNITRPENVTLIDHYECICGESRIATDEEVVGDYAAKNNNSIPMEIGDYIISNYPIGH